MWALINRYLAYSEKYSKVFGFKRGNLDHINMFSGKHKLLSAAAENLCIQDLSCSIEITALRVLYLKLLC